MGIGGAGLEFSAAMGMSACSRGKYSFIHKHASHAYRSTLHCTGPMGPRGTHQKRSQKQTNLGMIRVRLSSIASENAATICAAPHRSFSYQNLQYSLPFPRLSVLQEDLPTAAASRALIEEPQARCVAWIRHHGGQLKPTCSS